MDNNLENKICNKLIIEKKEIKKEKKIDFISKKDNTIHSLFQVEHFLCDFKKLFNTIKLYKILK